MSRKGQAGIATYFFTVVIFVIIWALWLGKFLSDEGQRVIATHSLTGLEAFFYGNINLVIFFCLLLGTVAVTYWGANQ